MADTAPIEHAAVRTRLPRADAILAAASAVVVVLALGLSLLLNTGSRAVDAARATAQSSRNIRSILIEMREAQFTAQAAQLLYIADARQERLAQYQEAKRETYSHLERLEAATSDLPDLAGFSDRVSTLIGADFGLMDERLRDRRAPADSLPIRTRFAATLPTIYGGLNTRIDVARAAEYRAQGSVRTIAVALALLSLCGAALSIYAVRREREQWRLAHEAADAARASAAASELAKTRFLAAASHDMRQPLHALTLYLNALARRVSTDEARDIVHKAERAAHSLSGMFTTLLDLARIQADVIKPDISAFPLREVIERIVSENPGADVKAEATSLEVISDQGLLERLLRNLVSNAIKHGGGKAHISVATEGGMAEISVRDEGPGIAAADQNRIFEEFVRLDGRASGEGLGLGLSIVERIADLLGHELELHSAPGEGATFVIRVPIAHMQATTSAAAIPQAETSLAGQRALVLDDDPQALEAVSRALGDLQADVRACRTEADMMAALEGGFAPHLLVMDLRIEGALVGIDIARRAAARLSPPPRVVIVTGDTGADTLEKLRASGFRWLIKPVDPHELARTASDPA